MKRRTEGKRFSRREILTAETWGEVDNLFKERGRTNEDGTQSLGGAQQYVEEARGQAVAFLKARTLPYTPMVYWRTDSEGWTGEKPPRKFFAGSSGLPSYVRGLGHGRDSLEDLAARIIWAAAELKKGDEEEKAPVRAAIELSEARTLAKIYGLDSATNRGNAIAPRRKAWAAELARELSATYTNFPLAWESLKGGEEIGIFAGYEVYIDGDFLCATNDTTGKVERPISRESFRTSYFSPARNGRL